MHRHVQLPRRFATIAALFLAVSLLVLACSPSAESAASNEAPGGTSGNSNTTSTALFDSTTVHQIDITFDQAAYDAMIATYLGSEVKEWIEATVTIDGQTYERVGIRLKGNSSLRSLDAGSGGPTGTVSSDQPETLPWLVSLDHFVDEQDHDGLVEFVVRSNNTATALNEAVALELLELAGLASQDAAPTRLSVNGSEQVLRLVVENPDDEWMAATFEASGALYKAESTGNYSYRGDDPAAYDEVFDQEAGADNADLTPLIDFLQFINESDDATFAAEIATRLDVDSFATYLAMQELLENFDDIDGPGNNSYLYYDVESAQFTVVPWDYNLAFGVGPGGGGRPNAIDPGTPPEGFELPAGGGFEAPAGGEGGRGFGGGSNILSQRFLAIADYQALVDQKTAELKAELYDSGTAASVLADWVSVLQAEATDLVDEATITSEAQSISAKFLTAG